MVMLHTLMFECSHNMLLPAAPLTLSFRETQVSVDKSMGRSLSKSFAGHGAASFGVTC